MACKKHPAPHGCTRTAAKDTTHCRQSLPVAAQVFASRPQRNLCLANGVEVVQAISPAAYASTVSSSSGSRTGSRAQEERHAPVPDARCWSLRRRTPRPRRGQERRPPGSPKGPRCRLQLQVIEASELVRARRSRELRALSGEDDQLVVEARLVAERAAVVEVVFANVATLFVWMLPLGHPARKPPPTLSEHTLTQTRYDEGGALPRPLLFDEAPPPRVVSHLG